MEASLSPPPQRTRHCSSPLSTVLSVSYSSSSTSLARCASESALQHCGAPPSTPVAGVRRMSRRDGSRTGPRDAATSVDARGRPQATARSRSASSCSPRPSVASSGTSERAEEYRGAPRPALIVNMNVCTLLRQRELALFPGLRLPLRRRRRESERRELHERVWAERRRQLGRAQLSDRLEMLQKRTSEPGPSARERLRALRLNAQQREAEYKREIKSMEARVRAMPLLLERQAVAAARRRLELQYERKLKELGLSFEWLQEKAQQQPPLHLQHHSSSTLQHTQVRVHSAAVPRCPAVRSPPPETVVVVRRSRSASSSLRSALSRTESASDLSGPLREDDPAPEAVVTIDSSGDEETT
ncbi:uncharacterized protein LOC144132841 isoform X2 [Amblyomma americanum]